ncbi:MAG: alanine racemase [Eubacteriales bacterium]|nr:alanine racemase [Eubacteriales bacterium]
MKDSSMSERKFLAEASDRFQTPCYVFDTDAFLDRAQSFRKIFPDKVRINYCMKANPFLIEASLAFTDRIEVCSPGEFLITKKVGIPAEKLLISGVLKKEEDIDSIVRSCREKAVYTAESPAQLDGLEKAAEKYGAILNVYLRLTSGNQFGMDEEPIIGIVKNFDAYRHLRFYGIHFFTGTQKHKMRLCEKETAKLDAFIKRLEAETGREVRHLEYGTGFGVPYFTDQKEDAISGPFLREFASMLTGMDYSGEISLEMGRALAFDSGYYLTKIRDMKRNGDTSYAITDGGIHQINYDGQLRGMYIPYLDLIRDGKIAPLQTEGGWTYTICGSLCTTNDILVSDLKSEKLKTGDVLVFERAGAYSFYEGMQLFLSHELPAVLLYSRKEGFRPARKRIELYSLNMTEK